MKIKETEPWPETSSISYEVLPFGSKRNSTLGRKGLCVAIDLYRSPENLIGIDLLAIQQKSWDRASFLYIFICEVRSSGVRASVTTVHIRKFYKT